MPYYVSEAPTEPQPVTDVLSLLFTLESNMCRRPAFRSWVKRELERGDLEGSDVDGLTMVSRGLDRLRSQGRAIDFQRYSWPQVLEQVSEGIEWEERHIAYRYGDGWTLEAVAEPDLLAESRHMGNCAWRLGVIPNQTLLSLRDPGRRPHANIWLREGRAFEIVGRAGEVNLKPQYVDRMRSFVASSPYVNEWDWFDPEESRPEPDQFGLRDGSRPLGDARVWFASMLMLTG